jgi:DNA-binding transcriptional MerR regulator
MSNDIAKKLRDQIDLLGVDPSTLQHWETINDVPCSYLVAAADEIDRLEKEVQDFELDSITVNLELRDALEEVEKLEKEVQKLSLDMIVAHEQAFDALHEVEKLKSAKNLCVFIATDYIELSFEKAQWQRDDWHKRCKKLVESLYADEEGD